MPVMKIFRNVRLKLASENVDDALLKVMASIKSELKKMK